MQGNEYGTGTYSDVLDTVAYQLAPALNKRGAHLWVEEVTKRTFVLGFSCWNESAREELWSWLHERLRARVTEKVYKALTFRDYSNVSPGPTNPSHLERPPYRNVTVASPPPVP